jgi:TRAP-type C4-dicarboxylate transport system permease small subunit
MFFYRKVLNLIFSVLNGVSATVAILMMVLVVLDVLIRTVAGRGISGSVQMVELGMLAVVFFSIANTQKLGEHVSVELFVNKLTLKQQKIIAILMLAIYTAFSGILTYYTFERAKESLAHNEVMWMGVEVIPQWPFRYIIPMGFFLLVLRLIDELISACSDLKTTFFH